MAEAGAPVKRPPDPSPGATIDEPPGPSARLEPLRVVRAAFWLGLAAGLLELGLLAARVEWAQNGLYQRSRHFLWMIPAVDLLIVLACGLVVALAGWLIPGGLPRRAAWLAGIPAVLAVLVAIPGLAFWPCLLFAAGVVNVAGSWWESRRRTWPRRWARCRFALLGVVPLLVAASMQPWLREQWWRVDRPPAPRGAPNVLLIVLDTVRADALSAYGYHRATTPNLDRLAARGVRFERAMSPSCWTLPAHASFFTGKWPRELGVGPFTPLDATTPTLAERLRDRGYATAGIVANVVFCGNWFGLDRGFVHYEDYPLDLTEMFRCSALGWLLLQKTAPPLEELARRLGIEVESGRTTSAWRKTAEVVSRDALRWLASRRDPERPWLLFLNFIDAHDPYLVPEGAPRPFGPEQLSADDARLLADWDRIDKAALTPRQAALARDSYDDCLAYLDAELGRLFAELERRGHLDNTYAIITADHGEHFGRHGLYGHRLSTYQQEIRVPLLVAGPGVPAGRTVREAVSLRDLPATVMDLIRLDAPAFPGRSLASTWRPGADGPGPSPALTEFDPYHEIPPGVPERPPSRNVRRSLVRDSLSYLWDERGGEELYHLDSDPHQLEDLSRHPDHEPTLREMRSAAEEVLPTGSDRADSAM